MSSRASVLSLALVAACGSGAAKPDAPPASSDAAADAPADAPPDAGPVMATDIDFEGALPSSIDPGDAMLTPSQDFAPLGPTGNTFGPTFLRAATGNTITVTVTGLPTHTKLSIGFLFAAIDSLDGTGTFPAGDFMRITLDGTQIFRESFANATADQIQSYVAPAGGELARRVDLGFQGPGGYYTDSAYDMGVDPQFQNLPHTAATAVITFQLEGDGVQSLDDESWAIDNLRVTAVP